MDPDVVQALVSTIELKDLSTAAHTWRVVLYSRAMAEELGLPHDEVDRIGMAAALHDLGKINVPERILQKPGRLTSDEFAIIRTHTTHGHELVLSMGEQDPIVLDLIRHHHERLDGSGYPDGLRGDQIHVGARIFAVIDTFDALTSHRPYRHEVGQNAARHALQVLRGDAGTAFDRTSVEMFENLFSTGRLDWIMEHFNDRAIVPGHNYLAELHAVARAVR